MAFVNADEVAQERGYLALYIGVSAVLEILGSMTKMTGENWNTKNFMAFSCTSVLVTLEILIGDGTLSLVGK